MSEAFDTTGRGPPEENERNLHRKGKGNSAANSGKQKKLDRSRDRWHRVASTQVARSLKS